MRSSVKFACAAAIAMAGLFATAQASSAMPMSPGPNGASNLTQDIAYGCGPGWHPNPWGRCVPFRRAPVYYGGGPYYGGPYNGGPRWGHPGWHRWHRW